MTTLPSRRSTLRPPVINPHAGAHRWLLRLLGAAFTVTGATFAVVGIVDFFQVVAAPSAFDPPQKFWCVFVGMPLLAIGLALLRLGFLGAFGRYVAGEAAPVLTDAVDCVAQGSAAGVREVVRAVREGLTGETGPTHACGHCGSTHPGSGPFCDDCGQPLRTQAECARCGAEARANARFCGQCGAELVRG